VQHIKGWVGGKGVGRVEGRVGRLTMPVDTANQVVCTVGQTDGHSSPDHITKNRHRVEQFAIGTTGHPINAPQWPLTVYVGPAWLDRVSKKPSVKACRLSYL